METTEIRPGVFLKHHEANICQGKRCPLHKPTNHEYRDYPLEYDYETQTMQRILDDGTKVLDPDDYRLNGPEKYLYRNSALCHGCNTEVVSTSRHDFVSCPCGNLSVDGGHAYTRRVFGDKGFTDTNVYIGSGHQWQ